VEHAARSALRLILSATEGVRADRSRIPAHLRSRRFPEEASTRVSESEPATDTASASPPNCSSAILHCIKLRQARTFPRERKRVGRMRAREARRDPNARSSRTCLRAVPARAHTRSRDEQHNSQVNNPALTDRDTIASRSSRSVLR